MEQSIMAIILGLIIMICGIVVAFTIEDPHDYSNLSEFQIIEQTTLDTVNVTSQGLIGLMMIACGCAFCGAGITSRTAPKLGDNSKK